MQEDYFIASRPLTVHMKELLMDCHERELLHLRPYDAGHVYFVRGLIVRGMLEVKEYQPMFGKKFQALFVTELGKEYLSYL